MIFWLTFKLKAILIAFEVYFHKETIYISNNKIFFARKNFLLPWIQHETILVKGNGD